MSLGNRIHRLLRKAKERRREKRLKDRTRLLTGLDWDDVLKAMAAAIDPADGDLCGKILALAEEAKRTLRTPPPRASESWYEGCENEYEMHYFVYWLIGLMHGSWALPQRLPRAVLEGFADRRGCILWRCEDCLTALANGNHSRYKECPVCGSANLSHKKLSGPPWDAHWQYTPLPAGGRGSHPTT
jgi:hypothetical protein